MAFNGAWERQGGKQVYDFNETAGTLAVVEEEASTVVEHRFQVDGNVVTLTPTNDKVAARKYDITTRSDSQLVLKRIAEEGDDSMEDEVIVLVPRGYPGPKPRILNQPDDDDDDESNGSGVDLGMELCIVGKKITK